MSEHLTTTTLSALADGELSPEQLLRTNQHLVECPQCTTNALAQSLLKSATARAGQRYTAPAGLRERIALAASQERAQSSTPGDAVVLLPARNFSLYALATAAALLLAAVSIFLLQRTEGRESLAASQRAALVTEASDQHIATLAADLQPQVVSTDRHTVKPWFQGKIPFSFNLPEALPENTTLDGANLTYLDNQPVAQLLYSIGKHRVSVFLREKPPAESARELEAEHSGFHVQGFTTPELEVVAVSDVDPARLSDLLQRIQAAQTGATSPPK